MQRDFYANPMDTSTVSTTTNYHSNITITNDEIIDGRITAEEAELVLVHRRQRLEELAERQAELPPQEPASVPPPLMQAHAASPQALFEAIADAAARARNERLSLVQGRSNASDDDDDSIDLTELLDRLRQDLDQSKAPVMQASSTATDSSIPSNIDCCDGSNAANAMSGLPSLEESAWWTSPQRASLLGKSLHSVTTANDDSNSTANKQRQLSWQPPTVQDQARLEALFGALHMNNTAATTETEITEQSDHSDRKESLLVSDLERNWTRRRDNQEEEEETEHDDDEEEDDFFQSSLDLSLDQSQFMRQMEHPPQQQQQRRHTSSRKGVAAAKNLDDSADTASTYCSDMSWSGWGSVSHRPIPEQRAVDEDHVVVREQQQH